MEALKDELVGTPCPSRIGVGKRTGCDACALGRMLGGLGSLVRE